MQVITVKVFYVRLCVCVCVGWSREDWWPVNRDNITHSNLTQSSLTHSFCTYFFLTYFHTFSDTCMSPVPTNSHTYDHIHTYSSVNNDSLDCSMTQRRKIKTSTSCQTQAGERNGQERKSRISKLTCLWSHCWDLFPYIWIISSNLCLSLCLY